MKRNGREIAIRLSICGMSDIWTLDQEEKQEKDEHMKRVGGKFGLN